MSAFFYLMLLKISLYFLHIFVECDIFEKIIISRFTMIKIYVIMDKMRKGGVQSAKSISDSGKRYDI
jgi:hypothetical protein